MPLTLAFLLVIAMLSPTSTAVGQNGTCVLPNGDTTPPFTDRCYHQGVWYSPDTTQFDVLIVPPTSPYELREWQLAEQSVANWETGIRALGAPWLSGLSINDYTLGREPVPPAALADPEVIVLLHATVMPLGTYAGAAVLPPSVCHGIQLPSDPTSLSSWHNHAGSPYGSYMAACGGGGRLCVVTNAATLGTGNAVDRQTNFDLMSHEVGHCLSLGHVGDADTESTDDSTAYPEHDIMSYENDGLHAATMHCPSNLNVRTIEKAFGALLGQPGATTQVAPNANAYVHMHPSDWQAPACNQSKATIADVGYLTSADPLGQAGGDADGDGIPDGEDRCPGFDDRADADGDLVADGCDDDDTDGPDGDQDGDGVRNADDVCPGIDDASPECRGPSAGTLYFGRGLLGSPSGNADVLYGDEQAFLAHSLTLKEEPPAGPDPAVLLVPGVDGAAPHNPFYEPGEWSTTGSVSLFAQDVEAVWWGIEPATGLAFFEEWEAKLFFDGAATPYATVRTVNEGLTDGGVPTEYRAVFQDVTGSGRLTIQIDPASFTNQQDFLVLYDSTSFPSRLIIGEVPDTDGDGVQDNVDACPGSDDRLDLDGDQVPDGCDADEDGDGVANAGDNCARTSNALQEDADADGQGDACDGDLDGDGAANASDNCPGTPNAGQEDLDGDGHGNACDDDRDGDTVSNGADAFPDDPSEWSDGDGDGVGDNADACAGSDDAADLDGDGTPDGCDDDRDGDGHGNDAETAAGSDPDDAASVPVTQPVCPAKPNGKPGKCKDNGGQGAGASGSWSIDGLLDLLRMQRDPWDLFG